MKSLCFWSQDFSVQGLNLLATAQQSRCKAELGATSPEGWSQQGHKNTLPAAVKPPARGLHCQQFQALAQDTAVLRCPGTGWWSQCMAEGQQQTASQGHDSGENSNLANTCCYPPQEKALQVLEQLWDTRIFQKQTCTYPVLSALCLAANLGRYLAQGTQKAPL